MTAPRSGAAAMLRDWGLALGLAVVAFVGWNLIFGASLPSEGPAPDFSLAGEDGAPVRLADRRGQTVVVNFWATWCGPCVAEIPELSAFQAAHPDVLVLGVATDRDQPTARVRAVAGRHGATYAVLHDADGAVSAAYGVSTLPSTVVVGPDGEIVASRVGALDREGLARLAGR